MKLCFLYMSWFRCFKSLQEAVRLNQPNHRIIPCAEPQSRLAMQLCSGLHGHSWDPKIGQKCQKPVTKIAGISWDLLDSMNLHPQISLEFWCKSFLVRPRWASLLVRQVSCWLQQSRRASHVAIDTYQRNLQLLPIQPCCIPHGTPWTLHSTMGEETWRNIMSNLSVEYSWVLYV